MMRFKVINNILGWIVFFIAAVTYLLTLEPTASWWDCGEFIISAAKLEVGHPPGAPFHMILGRFFTLFAPDPSRMAFMVNLLSALASAGTVMFLFWSIVHLSKKLFSGNEPAPADRVIVWGSGLTGALAFAFTDSFWFSAVEGEVYALSSFFTAAVFWIILKWENEADEKYANRWLILIAYLLGLSIGVHLLNLLAIPAIALVWYFRKYPWTTKGFLVSLAVGIGIIAVIQYIIIPGLPRLGFTFDKFFVNHLDLPFNSGLLFMVTLIIATAVWAIRITRKREMVFWNTAVTALVAILIGYSSFGVILIRASANPPMNQNQPDNAFSLQRYLNREQYGDRPLFYGPYYNAPVIGATGQKKLYSKIDGKYVVTGTHAARRLYSSEMETLFPRMYSQQPAHIAGYKDWGKVKGRPVSIMEQGEQETVMKPTFIENLRFFFAYQLGHMYFRYFMWNFAGRQNDTQGHGSFLNGNWISGIPFIDNPRVGPVDKMPGFMKNQPSRNSYYFLPLLFGLIGLFYLYNHSKKGRESFAVIMTLFIFTGLAIIVYLNQTPLQPRERDYAYAGSFFAFAILIGMAVPALWQVIRKVIGGVPGALLVTGVSLLLVPGILFAENRDDHDRSDRYMTRDYAINYLESCAPNAILFTYGDNDTFPLWYVQEVEGIRTDVKVVNLSYLGMDWYINQHRRASYEAAPVPFSYPEEKYFTGRRDAILVQDRIKGPIDLKEAMKFAGSEDERTKIELSGGGSFNFFPSKDFYLAVDKQKVLETGTVQPEDSALIADTITFRIDKPYLSKSEWAVLNIIAANDWERPVYINHSLLHTGHIFFTRWLQFEGLAYRFVPIQNEKSRGIPGHVNTQILYDHVMNKYVWGNVNDPEVFLDEYNIKELKIIQARRMFARLAEALSEEGQKERAEAVIDKMFFLFPDERIPLDHESFAATEQYYRVGAFEKGNEKIRKMVRNSFSLMEYYLSLPLPFARAVEDQQNREISHIRNMLVMTKRYNQTALHKEIDDRLKKLIDALSGEVDS